MADEYSLAYRLYRVSYGEPTGLENVLEILCLAIFSCSYLLLLLFSVNLAGSTRRYKLEPLELLLRDMWTWIYSLGFCLRPVVGFTGSFKLVSESRINSEAIYV